jgi:hypothetical protein
VVDGRFDLLYIIDELEIFTSFLFDLSLVMVKASIVALSVEFMDSILAISLD